MAAATPAYDGAGSVGPALPPSEILAASCRSLSGREVATFQAIPRRSNCIELQLTARAKQRTVRKRVSTGEFSHLTSGTSPDVSGATLPASVCGAGGVPPTRRGYRHTPPNTLCRSPAVNRRTFGRTARPPCRGVHRVGPASGRRPSSPIHPPTFNSRGRLPLRACAATAARPAFPCARRHTMLVLRPITRTGVSFPARVRHLRGIRHFLTSHPSSRKPVTLGAYRFRLGPSWRPSSSVPPIRPMERTGKSAYRNRKQIQ
jgi:hypothetical protein